MGWCLQVATRVPGELATAARSLATLTRCPATCHWGTAVVSTFPALYLPQVAGGGRGGAQCVPLPPARGPGQVGGVRALVPRVIVWPRESVVGAKDPGAFVMAVCELSGQVRGTGAVLGVCCPVTSAIHWLVIRC